MAFYIEPGPLLIFHIQSLCLPKAAFVFISKICPWRFPVVTVFERPQLVHDIDNWLPSPQSLSLEMFLKSRSLPHALQIICVDKWSSSTIRRPFGTFVDAGTAVGEGSGETLSHSLSGADLTRFCIRLDALIDWNRPDLCLTFPSMVLLSSPTYTQNKHRRSIVAIFLH